MDMSHAGLNLVTHVLHLQCSHVVRGVGTYQRRAVGLAIAIVLGKKRVPAGSDMSIGHHQTSRVQHDPSTATNQTV